MGFFFFFFNCPINSIECVSQSFGQAQNLIYPFWVSLWLYYTYGVFTRVYKKTLTLWAKGYIPKVDLWTKGYLLDKVMCYWEQQQLGQQHIEKNIVYTLFT